MINLGTRHKPNLVRHNIKGDPNKFVVLTHQEHAKTNYNRLEWIRVFEDMIEEKYEGKCYFTKEEYTEAYPTSSQTVSALTTGVIHTAAVASSGLSTS